MVEMVLTCGATILLDNEDYLTIPKTGWYLSKKECHNPKTDYAQHDTYGKMHRYILGILPNERKGFVVDHLNGNGLDNRKSNLRIVTTSQNKKNIISAYSNNILKYSGISLEISEKRKTYRFRVSWSEGIPEKNKDNKYKAKQKTKSFSFKPNDFEDIKEKLKQSILYRNKKCLENDYILDERSTTIEKAILSNKNLEIEKLLGINLEEIVLSRVGSSESKKESPKG